MMGHPNQIDGILYRSRHDPDRINVALFKRNSFLPSILDPDLDPSGLGAWKRKARHGNMLVCGNPIPLCDHPALNSALIELQVARLP
jgi:hypothetical protein